MAVEMSRITSDCEQIVLGGFAPTVSDWNPPAPTCMLERENMEH
jgi:hypothetical protein